MKYSKVRDIDSSGELTLIIGAETVDILHGYSEKIAKVVDFGANMTNFRLLSNSCSPAS